MGSIQLVNSHSIKLDSILLENSIGFEGAGINTLYSYDIEIKYCNFTKNSAN